MKERKNKEQYPAEPRQRKPKESDNWIKRFCFEEEADCECMMCGEFYANSRPGEQWIQCMTCSAWCHEDCSSGETSGGFICDFCRPD